MLLASQPARSAPTNKDLLTCHIFTLGLVGMCCRQSKTSVTDQDQQLQISYSTVMPGRYHACQWLLSMLLASVHFMPHHMVTALTAPYIVTPAQFQTLSQSSSAESVSCYVAVQPYSIYYLPPNLSAPSIFSSEAIYHFAVGTMTMSVVNAGTENVTAPWELQISSSHYRAALEASP